MWGRIAGGIAAAGAFCILGVVSASAQARTFHFGANGHPFSAYEVSREDQLALMHDLGLTSYRINVRSVDDLPSLERMIDAAQPFGITIIPVLTPGIDLDSTSPADIRRATSAFADAYVRRLRSKIRDWELGNELENYAIITACEMRDDGTQYNCDWGPAGGLDPLDYYGPRWEKVSAYLRGLAEGVMKVDPAARKAIGTAGWGHMGAMKRLAADGVPWDISVWHMYGQDPEWAFKELAAYGKPIWVTEFNHPLADTYDTLEQADGLAFWMRRLEELSKTYPVEVAHIYELLDEPYWLPSNEARMGLLSVEKDRSGRWTKVAAKPSYDAVRDYVFKERALADKEVGCTDRTRATRGEPATQTVSMLYCVALRRLPTNKELADALPRIEAGDALGVLRSAPVEAEWRLRCPPERCGSMAYLRLLFRSLLGREPDQVARDSYIRGMETGEMTRRQVLDSILTSREFAELRRIQLAGGAAN